MEARALPFTSRFPPLASVGLLLFGDQGATRDFCCPSGTVSARRVSKLFDSFMDIWGRGLTVGGIKSKLSPVNLLGKLFFPASGAMGTTSQDGYPVLAHHRGADFGRCGHGHDFSG
jgi:hypothetical protein